ncbi:hypothetical protein NIES37_71160 (plasmid) [Tolypothrix tenuis PCC 7101]|uniref:DUF4186 domain-containing protein n=1 Tax=Tolypothrix tenuis PCC 7101 TaxID=231146 RepID=A0A1Z4NBK7_9CYAN|nr:DUF4186 family protein [Aulosira sp. FACHB-113]BAZ03103.1 hypothetical protein NIES37_71160 [Tolypothrix tenuis PCC 7101]BAZ78625.1 hypothetical protein NIES50_72580 [Aulosira laxa NIES-50]
MTQNQTITLKPLKISCTSSDCDNGLHCFKNSQKKKVADQIGQCHSCGADLVDWSRVQKRDLSDVNYTFAALKRELIRHYFWHVEISQKAINHARRKGKSGMRDAVEKRIRKSVGSAEPAYDGRQTPGADSDKANAIHYAQHATACCCRKCIEYWHNIPLGRELTEEEIGYFSDLVMLYINERLPFLTENGEEVPRLKPLRCEESSSTEDEGG